MDNERLPAPIRANVFEFNLGDIVYFRGEDAFQTFLRLCSGMKPHKVYQGKIVGREACEDIDEEGNFLRYEDYRLYAGPEKTYVTVSVVHLRRHASDLMVPEIMNLPAETESEG